MNLSEAIQLLLNQGAKTTQPTPIGDYGLRFPDGTILDTDDYTTLDKPRAFVRELSTSSPVSFTDYLRRHGNDLTELHLHASKVEAILDAPGPNDPAWQAHTISLQPRRTWEWERWTALFGSVAQTALAEALDQLLHTIADPAGTTLLDLAEHLEGSVNAKFATGARLANGARTLIYQEDISTTVEVPPTITLVLPVFAELDPIELRVNLRYRIREGAVTFQLSPTTPVAEIERAQVEVMTDQVLAALGAHLLAIRH